MTGAATRNCKHGVFGFAVVLAAAAVLAGHLDRAAGATHAASRPQASLPGSIQALELGPAVARSASKDWLRNRHSHHATALIADRTRLGSPLFLRVRNAAWAAGLRVMVPVPASTRERGVAACARLAQGGSPCFLVAPTRSAAVQLSRIPRSVVAVRLPSLTAFQRLGASGHGRILGIVPLRLSAGRAAWLRAIALARRSPKLDLAVAPVAGAEGAKGLATFEQLLNVKTVAGVEPPDDSGSGTGPGPGAGTTSDGGTTGGETTGGGTAGGAGSTGSGGSTGGGGGGTPVDTFAPTTPLGLTKASSTSTSITISWSPSTDNVAVNGYGVSIGGSTTSTPQTSIIFAGLTCATTYAVTVDAFDAAGNRSAKAAASYATSACAGGGVVVDTTVPSTPSGLHLNSTTTTSISIGWTASTDNVGVAGYYMSRDGTRIATTTSVSYTFTGLACGTAYSLAVSAFDLAGNTSSAAFATTVQSTSACATPPPPPPPPPPTSGGTASVFLAAGGSDANGCTAVAPCASFNRGYRVAQPGQTVEVAAGTYPPQTIQVDSSKASTSDVVIRPASGATVTVGCPSNGSGCIDVYASHLTLSGFRTAQMPARGGEPVQGSISQERAPGNCPCDVTWENIDAGSFQLTGTDITVRGGDYGPSATNNGGAAGANVNSQFVDPLNNVTLDGVLIHDYKIAFSGDHFECLFVDSATNVVIRNSEFRSCDVFAIAAIIEPGATATNWLIENSVFWNPRGLGMSNEMKFDDSKGGTCSSITIRYNLISDNIYDGCSPMTVVGNIQRAAQATCIPGWDYNVFVNATACGSHAVRGSNAMFVNPRAGNFRLRPRSAAVGRGDPNTYPRRDRVGRRRPLGGKPDAGPYEAAK